MTLQFGLGQPIPSDMVLLLYLNPHAMLITARKES